MAGVMSEAAKKLAGFVVVSPDDLRELINEAVKMAIANTNSAADDSEHVTLSYCAVRLHCSTRTVRRYIDKGRLSAAKVEEGCSRVLVTRESLEHLISVSTR